MTVFGLAIVLALFAFLFCAAGPVFDVPTGGRIKALYDERASVYELHKAVLDKAEAEKRVLSAEDRQVLDRHDARMDEISDEIKRREAAERRAAELEKSRGRQTDPEIPGKKPAEQDGGGENITVTLGRDRFMNEPRTLTLEPTLIDGTINPAFVRAQKTYRKAFAGYMMNGREQAGLQVASDPAGGYLAPTQMIAGLIQNLDNLVWMRQISTILPPSNAKSMGVVSLEADPSDANWTAEVPASALTADTSMSFGKRQFSPNLLSKLIKLSQKLMRAVPAIEALVNQRLSYKFAVVEENAYMNGTGADQPLGVFVADNDGIPTSRDTTASSTTAFVADDLIDTQYSTKKQYRANGSWVLHRDGIKRCRKLKDGNGQYIWQPGLQPGEPERLLNSPLYESEYAPNTFTTGLYVAIFGDFRAGYWIQDGLDYQIQMLMELFAATNQVGLIGRKETDGAPVLAEAFGRLKLA